MGWDTPPPTSFALNAAKRHPHLVAKSQPKAPYSLSGESDFSPEGFVFLLPDTLNQAIAHSVDSWMKENRSSLAASIGLYQSFVQGVASKCSRPEISLIPMGISAFNPHARFEQGRAGLWQLSVPVARKYGLEVNHLHDERLDPIRSTEAANKYLADLNKELTPEQGVIALYLGVSRAKRVVDTLGNFMLEEVSHEEFDLLSQFFALIYVGTNFKKIPVTPYKFETPWKGTRSHTFPKPLHETVFKKFLSIDSTKLAHLNPVHQFPLLLGTTDHPLVLPEKAAKGMDTLQPKMYAYQDSVTFVPKKIPVHVSSYTATIPKGTNMVWYSVRSGDVLGAIASRYGVSVRQLKGWNNLHNDMIYAGQKLKIYVGKQKPKVSEPAPPKPKIVPQPSGKKGKLVQYTIQPGDTLWGISKKYPGVSADEIQKWNNISTDIKPGQVIKIYLPK